MQKKIRKLAISAIAALASALTMSAQGIEDFLLSSNYQPSVETGQVAKYGQVSHSLNTGTMHHSIPLFSFHDTEFNLPISLEYSYNGYRPSQSSGTIGLGWALSCGGIITRDVRGLEDERNELVAGAAYLPSGQFGDVTMKGCYWAMKEGNLVSAVEGRVLRTGSSLGGSIQFLEHGFIDENLLYAYPYTDPVTWYDTDPDIYHFSFCGISGEFIFTSDGVKVYNCSAPRGEISVNVTTSGSIQGCRILRFTIETGDGYKYVFGGSVPCCEYSQSSGIYNDGGGNELDYQPVYGNGLAPSCHITAWKLSSIEAPSGNTLTFNYSTQPNPEVSIVCSETPASLFEENTMSGYTSRTYYVLNASMSHPLSSVSWSNGQVIKTVFSLDYSDVTEAENDIAPSCYSRSSDITTYFSNRGLGFVFGSRRVKLTAVTFRNLGGQQVDKATLTHSHIGSSTGNRSLTLASVSRLGEGTHSFTYYAPPLTLPLKDYRYPDLWGYWIDASRIGAPFTDDTSMILQRYFGDNLDDTSKYTSGALHQIRYPAGGTTTIEYEQNDISACLNRSYTSMPSLIDCRCRVGGIRVKKITTTSSLSSQIRTFKYIAEQPLEDGTFPSSGICTYVPRQSFQVHYKRYSISTPSGIRCVGSRVAGDSCRGIVSIFTSSAMPKCPVREDVVNYSRVVEEMSDGSSICHDFTSWDEVYADSFTDNSPTGAYWTSDVEPRSDWDRDRMICLLAPAREVRTALRGREYRTTWYDPDGDTVRKVEKNFESRFETGRMYHCNYAVFWKTVPQNIYYPYLIRETQTDYIKGSDGSRGISTETSYSYNELGQLTETETSSYGHAVKKTIGYSHESPSASDASVLPSAVSDIRRFTKNSSGAWCNTSLLHFGYDHSADSRNPRPVSITEVGTASPSTTSLTTTSHGARTTTFSYDGKLRLTRVDRPGSAYTTYAWDEYESNILSRCDNGPLNTTSYTWFDQVGLESVSYPTGISESYSYDEGGRLSGVRNSFGESTDDYIYTISQTARNTKIQHKTYTSYAGSFIEDIDYYDGLGYLEQSIQKGATPLGHDLVRPYFYDSYRRADAKEALPFVSSVGGGYYCYYPEETHRYYYSLTGPGFTMREYEAGPLGRPVSELLPGYARNALDKKKHFEYGFNEDDDAVLKIEFTTASSLLASHLRTRGVIPADKLHKTTTISEESDTSIVFCDVSGKVLLERKLSGGIRHDTYRVYDLRDSLVMVLQPECSATLQANATVYFTDLRLFKGAFAWKYDCWGRLIESRTPHMAVTQYAYDMRDRLILRQDPAMASCGKMAYFTYDSYDRPVSEGYRSSSDSMSSVRSQLEAGRTLAYNIGSDVIETKKRTYFTTTHAVPAASVPALSFQVDNATASYSDLSYARCKMQPSYEKVYESPQIVSGTMTLPAAYVERAYWYDNYGRMLQKVEKRPDGKIDRYTYKYDFRGNVTSVSEQHADSHQTNTSDMLVTRYTYDSRSRLTSTQVALNSAIRRTVTYGYDELGRLSSRSGDGGLVSDAMSYNITSQPTYLSTTFNGTRVFQRNIKYYPLSSYQMSDTDARYDGLIAATVDLYMGDAASTTVAYSYDGLGRLTSATAGNASSPTVGEQLAYSLNGNVTSATRTGTAWDGTFRYTYDVNRLTGVQLPDGTSSGQYSWDANGRMTKDGLRGVNISYSAVGMPRTISQVAISSDGADDGMLASYTYLDDGTKLSVTTPDGDGRVYRGSFVYGEDGSTVEQVLLAEGMFEKASGDAEGSNYGYRSLWFAKDQVGSIVSVINITDSDASANEAVVMKTGYLPFGSEWQNANFVSDASMRYRFNGKETQPWTAGSSAPGTLSSLPNLLDYGARSYDPLTCSWTTPDPLAHKYLSWSPYTFCTGDPVNFVDPDGQFPDTIWDIANAFMDVYSLVSNIKDGSYGAAAIDGVAFLTDALAAFIPFVPGGASAIVRAVRGGDHTLDAFKAASEFGVDSYSNLRKSVLAKRGKGSGLEVHHLIEQRFAKRLGIDTKEMKSIVLTKEEHKEFTKRWRELIPYANPGKDIYTTTVNEEKILETAKMIYKDHPELLQILGIK